MYTIYHINAEWFFSNTLYMLRIFNKKIFNTYKKWGTCISRYVNRNVIKIIKREMHKTRDQINKSFIINLNLDWAVSLHDVTSAKCIKMSSCREFCYWPLLNHYNTPSSKWSSQNDRLGANIYRNCSYIIWLAICYGIGNYITHTNLIFSTIFGGSTDLSHDET